MPTRVLTILRGADPGAARTHDPALDVTAFAVAEDVELTLLLRGLGVEHAVRGATTHAVRVAGREVPSATPGADIAALVASGVRVLAADEDLRARGIRPDDLLDGVEPVDEPTVAHLVLSNDVTLSCA